MTFRPIGFIYDENKKYKSGEPCSTVFEKLEVSIVCDEEGKYYMRVFYASCALDREGRPHTSISDCCYPIDPDDADRITKENWREFWNLRDDNRVVLKDESYTGMPDFI